MLDGNLYYVAIIALALFALLMLRRGHMVVGLLLLGVLGGLVYTHQHNISIKQSIYTTIDQEAKSNYEILRNPDKSK
jgi:hypothetical protein